MNKKGIYIQDVFEKDVMCIFKNRMLYKVKGKFKTNKGLSTPIFSITNDNGTTLHITDSGYVFIN